MIEVIRNIDFYLSFIYFIIFLSIILYSSSRIKDSSEKKTFIWFTILKLISSQLYCYVYLFYYKYGDTQRFFRFGQMYKNLLFDVENIGFFEWLTMNNETFKEHVRYQIDYAYGFAESSFMINKLSAFCSIFTFNSFLVNTMLFSIFSITGIWKMYTTFTEMYPMLRKEFRMTFLFVPSVVFWGSGLMKDTICIGAIGWLLWSVSNLFFLKNKSRNIKILSVVVFYFSTLTIFYIKTYIILSLLSGIFVWILFRYRDKIKSSILRRSFTPILLTLSVVGILIGLQIMSEELNKYALENVIDTALSLSSSLSKLDAGSSYDLGAIDPSLFGLIQKIPAAVNVTLFRPYLWEVNNVVMIFAALESLLILLMSAHIFLKVGIFKTIGRTFDSGDIFFCFIFSIIFGFATGLSSNNFGSLVRYKIPIMPIYLSGLIILYYKETGKSYLETLFKKNKKLKQ